MVKNDNEQNIELGGDEPNIPAIIGELEHARTAASHFYGRMRQAKRWWLSEHPGMTVDGRKHLEAIINADAADANATDDMNCFPWENAADCRPKTLASLVRDHVMVSKFAFFKAKIQATKIRPMDHPGETTKATRALRWRLYVHQWAELLREMPRVFNWFWGYGLGVLGVGWQQSRRLDYVEFSLPDLDQILQTQGGQDPSNWLWLLDALQDPKQEDALVTLIQQLTPVLEKNRPAARKIVRDLREVRTAKLPVAYPYTNKPVWYAMKPTIDCLWPGETTDLQAARWFCDMHEWLSETELRDRQVTEGYDDEFVEEAIKHAKGLVPEQTQTEPTEHAPSIPADGNGKLIQMYHHHYKATIEGVPILLTTSFNPLVKDRSGNTLYAKHGPCYYDHGQYPAVAWTRLVEGRRLYDAVGLAEEAYTDEQNVKRQLDGLSDRTSLINRPAMIVPQNKVGKMQGGAYGPGKILGIGRAREVEWGPIPPTDGTPIELLKFVTENLRERYPLFGAELDDMKKQLYRDEVTQDTLGPTTLAAEMTFQLMQQYEDDEEIAKVAGEPGTPFHLSSREIQGRHNITATTNVQMLDEDYAKNRMALIGQAMAFKQEGVLFDLAVEALDPEVAELLKQSEGSPAAQEKEKAEERQAISNAMAGIEDPLPMFGNYKVRSAELLKHTVYSQNPMMKTRLAAAPDAQQILANRLQFFQRQIQQFEQNPQIGRALQTRTFQPGTAPDLMNAAQSGGQEGGY